MNTPSAPSPSHAVRGCSPTLPEAHGLQPAAYIQHVIEHIAEAETRKNLIASDAPH